MINIGKGRCGEGIKIREDAVGGERAISGLDASCCKMTWGHYSCLRSSS